MSLVVAVQHPEGWILSADSYHGVSDVRVPGSPKISAVGDWLVGCVGGNDDSSAYLRGLRGDEELDQQSFHIERMKWWRQRCLEMGDGPARPVTPDLITVFARGRQCFAVNGPTGQLCPMERYGAIGCAQEMALLLLYESLGFEGALPEREEAQITAEATIARITVVDRRVALPVFTRGT